MKQKTGSSGCDGQRYGAVADVHAASALRRGRRLGDDAEMSERGVTYSRLAAAIMIKTAPFFRGGMSARFIWGALAAAAAVALTFVLFPARLSVEVATIERGNAAEIVYATGVVEPVRWAAVAPLVRERIVETCDCEGESVAEGVVIFRLDDSEARARLAELDARLTLAQIQLTRAADLLGRRVGTQANYDQAAAHVAELQAARAAQSEKLKTYISRAPLAGKVLRLDGDIGEVVTPGEPLAWVGRPAPKHVVADVNEEDVPRVAVGQKALLKADAFPQEALEAEVSSITPKGDPVLKTYRVRLALPDDTPLFIGMTVETNIVTREILETRLAPSAAVVEGPDGPFLWVVDDGVVSAQSATLGLRSAENVEIVEGPAAGVLVVSPALEALEDGDAVRVVPRGGG